MSNVSVLNVKQNEVGGQNDPLSILSMNQLFGQTPADIPTSLNCNQVAAGFASGFSPATGGFLYTCDPSEVPAPGQPAVDVVVFIEADVQNGNDPACICDGVFPVCLTIQPGSCVGFEATTKSTTWTCQNGFDGCTLAELFAGAGANWNAATDQITSASGGGANAATGDIAFTSTGITGYTPSQAELDAAKAAGGTIVRSIIAIVQPAAPNEACSAAFTINITIDNPCQGIEFFPVDFSS